MISWRAYFKKLAPCAVLASLFCLPVFAGAHAPEPWLVEIRSFDAVYARQNQIGAAIGNAMLPMMLVTLAQQRMVKMFGKMRAADRIRWAGYPDGAGSADVVMIYPSVDKVAKMTLNHPGAEKVSKDTVLLPADEGRPMPTYAVFSEDLEWCAFARTPELARRALREKFPDCGGELAAIGRGGASGAFDFDEKGFKYTVRTATPANSAKLKDIPLLGAFAADGVTRYVTFGDVKKLVTTLIKNFANVNLKGN